MLTLWPFFESYQMVSGHDFPTPTRRHCLNKLLVPTEIHDNHDEQSYQDTYNVLQWAANFRTAEKEERFDDLFSYRVRFRNDSTVDEVFEYLFHYSGGRQDLRFLRDFQERHPAFARQRHALNGSTPLTYACATQAPYEVIAYLLDLYPEALRIPDDNGQLPVHHACSTGASLRIIQLLVERHPTGAGTLLALRRYSTLPLHCACQSSIPALATIRYLVEQCPRSVLQEDDGGRRALHAACASQASLQIVQFLARQHPESLNIQADEPFPWTPAGFARHSKRGTPQRNVIAWLDAVSTRVIDISQDEVPSSFPVVVETDPPPQEMSASTRIAGLLEPRDKGNPRQKLEGFAFLSFRTLLGLHQFPKRQELPAGALLEPPRDDLWLAIFVSHKWAAKPEDLPDESHHPDPFNVQLNALQEFVRRVVGFFMASRGYENEYTATRYSDWVQVAYVAGSKGLQGRHADTKEELYDAVLDHCGVWYDYSCLYQKKRSEQQEEVFRRELRNLNKVVRGSSCNVLLRFDADGYEKSGWCQWEMAASITTDYTAGLCDFPLRVQIEAAFDPLQPVPSHLQAALRDWETGLATDAQGNFQPELLRKALTSVHEKLMTDQTMQIYRSSPLRLQPVETFSNSVEMFARVATPIITAMCNEIIAGNILSVDIGKVLSRSLEQVGLSCTQGADRKYLGLKLFQIYAPVGSGTEGFSRRMLKEGIRRFTEDQSLRMFLLFRGDAINPCWSSFHFEDDDVGYLLYPPPPVQQNNRR